MSHAKDIRDAVEHELSYDPLAGDPDISVKDINGDVALNGTVPGYPHYLEAAATVRRVAGVQKLQNHLEVVLPSGDYRDDPTRTTMASNALAGLTGVRAVTDDIQIRDDANLLHPDTEPMEQP